MSDSSDTGAFLSGLVVGGLIGAAVAVVLAPQSGEETRGQIRQRGVELRERADTEAQQIRLRAEQTLADVRAQTEDMQRRSLELAEETREKVSAAIEQGVEQAKKAGEGLTAGKKKEENTNSAS